jgi:hypothetical protein
VKHATTPPPVPNVQLVTSMVPILYVRIVILLVITKMTTVIARNAPTTVQHATTTPPVPNVQLVSPMVKVLYVTNVTLVLKMQMKMRQL